jgi:uncharacterized protein (TIGR03067 family)
MTFTVPLPKKDRCRLDSRSKMAMLAAAFTSIALVWPLLIVAPGRLAAESKSENDSIQGELKKLEGTWHHVSREVGGKQVAGEDKESLFVIRGNVGVFKRGTKVGQICTIKLVDIQSVPKKIDLIVTDGDNEGITMFAIYEVNADSFKYCGSIGSRPTSFATSPDDKAYTNISTYKRVESR